MPGDHQHQHDHGGGGEMEEGDSEVLVKIRRDSINYSYASPLTGRRRRRSTVKQPIIPASLRVATNAAALLSCIFFSGIIFGWAPLKLILIREHQFSELCADDFDSNGDKLCVQQLDKFNYIFTLAQFMLSFASLPIGFFLDHSYKTVHYAVAAVLQISGLLIFGTSDSHENGHDLFVTGYTLMSLGGCMTMLGAFPASFLLPKYQAGILAAISCLFDFSSIIFTIFNRLNLYNSTIFSRQNMFIALAGFGVFVYGTLISCWLFLERRDWTTVVDEESKERQEDLNKNGASEDANDDEKDGRNANAKHTDYIRRLGIHDWSLQRQLCTYEYLLVVLFAAVQMLRCNFYIETVNELLLTYGDTQAYYANIFSFVLPCGIVFIPIIDATVRQLGVVGTLNVTNILGIVFGTVLLVPSLNLQTINFAVFACFRAFLYATLNTFIAFSFGVRTMGRVIGCTFTTAAVVTLLQYPAATFAENEEHTDFTTINLIMLASCIIPVGLSLGYSNMLAKNQGSVGETAPLRAAEVY